MLSCTFLTPTSFAVASILISSRTMRSSSWSTPCVMRNDRTDSEYENALIEKNFAFQLVNSYISFFYIAFAKPLRPNLLLLRARARAVHEEAARVRRETSKSRLRSDGRFRRGAPATL